MWDSLSKEDAYGFRGDFRILGHAELETTAIYTEASIRQLQEVHAHCHTAASLPENDPALGSST